MRGNDLIIEELKRRPHKEMRPLVEKLNEDRYIWTGGSGPVTNFQVLALEVFGPEIYFGSDED